MKGFPGWQFFGTWSLPYWSVQQPFTANMNHDHEFSRNDKPYRHISVYKKVPQRGVEKEKKQTENEKEKQMSFSRSASCSSKHAHIDRAKLCIDYA